MSELKIERLKIVLSKIEDLGKFERNFGELEIIRREEYRLEGGSEAEYLSYGHNLEQTGWKQASTYTKEASRNSMKGAPSEFKDYVNNFKQDVQGEIIRLEF